MFSASARFGLGGEVPADSNTRQCQGSQDADEPLSSPPSPRASPVCLAIKTLDLSGGDRVRGIAFHGEAGLGSLVLWVPNAAALA